MSAIDDLTKEMLHQLFEYESIWEAYFKSKQIVPNKDLSDAIAVRKSAEKDMFGKYSANYKQGLQNVSN